jgi:hypothetical protein
MCLASLVALVAVGCGDDKPKLQAGSPASSIAIKQMTPGAGAPKPQ